jgi:hypothetical protein
MKKRLALFKNVEYGWVFASEESRNEADDYIRITEYVEVDFTELPLNDVINSQIESLDKAAEEMGKKYMEGLESIKRKKAELLSLTVQK